MSDQKLIIKDSKIHGEVNLQGAKNSVLPILAACLLVKGQVVLKNVPVISDVYASLRILTKLGCKCYFDCKNNTVTVDSKFANASEISEELANEMRSSVFYMGSMTSRFGKCEIAHPGGCDLGLRPINLHIESLRKMSAEITEKHGRVIAEIPGGFTGADIVLPVVSVGVTENIMLAAVLADGETVISNAATEPEVIDLMNFLNKCGAKIKKADEREFVIQGVKNLCPCEYSIIPDRIACATYMAAAVITGGNVIIHNAAAKDLKSVLDVFERMGTEVIVYPGRISHNQLYADSIAIYAGEKIKAVKNITTGVHPGFPTDAQPIIMAVLAKAGGVSQFEDTIFDGRYKHISELLKLGADISVKNTVATIYGKEKLLGAKVSATDLRGGAGLVVAALSAEGETEISEIQFIDRGYEDIEKVISSIGGNIVRI
ncbi:MAG: UDP-N-acetylglucosamine 1-carboxyvinyltransferase [Ruminococcus sp.]|jgi:UDP-N-acetylglucosamine 1-carboxyvinyltransferase|nr:UDP-N-acetylglucosamine 1-carboxyvinyltransferase [Ruminococcus sp.]